MSDRKERGVLAVISGFSGAGKDTLAGKLIREYGDYALSVSATTRAERPGEQDGKDYFFVSKERFLKMIADEELLEYAEYVGNYYGTPKAYVEQKLADGENVLLVIEINGALNVKKLYPEAVLIYIVPPSASDIRPPMPCSPILLPCGTSLMSAQAVASSATAYSGRRRHAAAIAPDRPISSRTLKTNQTSCGGRSAVRRCIASI